MGDSCHGNGARHCCFPDGDVCPHLEVDTVPGRHWVCGLFRELGSWAAVHEDPRYREWPGNFLQAAGAGPCGFWQGAGPIRECCFSDTNEPVFS